MISKGLKDDGAPGWGVLSEPGSGAACLDLSPHTPPAVRKESKS